MRTIFFALDWAAEPLYVIMATIIAWYFYRFLQIRSDMSSTYFELERDIARRRQANILTIIVVAIQICVLVFGVQVRAVPYLEAERDLASEDLVVADANDDVPFFTDTPEPIGEVGLDLAVGTPLDQESDIIVLTPTLTPTPVGTIVPNAPPIEGCNDPRAQLQIPANGQRVFGPIVVRGTAYTENFTEAKIEVRGPSTLGQFLVDASGIAQAREITDLAQFQPAPYSEGAYQFRLMVFDNTTQLVASCQVTIYITDPPAAATATPSGG